jgi:phosphopantetheine--protein transferase-like protein
LVTSRAAVPDVPEAHWDEWLAQAVRDGVLHVREAELARELPAARRATFVGGRHALRRAMQQLAVQQAPLRQLAVPPHDEPVLRTPRGAPAVPAAFTGSITHKQTLAMAALAPREGTLQYVGIDLERRPADTDRERPSIAARILTPREFDKVAALGERSRAGRELTVVHFALKEAVYKAIDPFVERYVRFTEVELDITAPDAVRVQLHLPEREMADVQVDARYTVDDEWIVATASSHRER